MNPNAAASIAATVVPTAAPVTPPPAATPVVVAIVRSGVDIGSSRVVDGREYLASPVSALASDARVLLDNLEVLCRPSHRVLEQPGGSFSAPAPPTSPRWDFLSPIRETARVHPRVGRYGREVAELDEPRRETPVVAGLGRRDLDEREAA